MSSDLGTNRRVFAYESALNQDNSFDTWDHFDPGVYLDMNPSIVTLKPGNAAVVFCRYPVPPVPGTGSIWTIAVDTNTKPLGRPQRLIADGIDPRVIRIGPRVFVFYALIERDAQGVIDGSCVCLAEFTVDADLWTCVSVFKLPKAPITGHTSTDAQANWEKNWVPFAIDDGRIGLLYSHEPWDVLTLNVEAGASPKLEALDRGPSLGWDFGTIRGGTPPVPYDDDHLITFFHAAQVSGSRRLYTVGACVFRATAPYSPVLQTQFPLLTAPYKSVATRFGWGFAGSVFFPLGAERIEAGYRLICGLDDGEIATFVIDHAALAARLHPTKATAPGTLHDFNGSATARLPLQGLLYVPDPPSGIPDRPVITFIKSMLGGCRTFVDAGAGFGPFTMPLAPRCARVVAFEPDALAFQWLKRNRSLNDYEHVVCEHTMLGDPLERDEHESATVGVSPVVALDAYGFTDVDLLKIDLPGHEAAVLQGALHTIAQSRPIILIRAAPDVSPWQALMSSMRYTTEAVFPLTPAWILCFPLERRDQFAWFV